MKNLILGKDIPIKPVPSPFKVKHGLTAIEFGKTDESILQYLHFFSSIVPFEKKTFIHVIPEMSLLDALFTKVKDIPFNRQDLRSRLVRTLQDKIQIYFSPENKTNQAFIMEGDPLENLLKAEKEINADLLLIGQDSNKRHHDILGKNLVQKSKGNALIIPSAALTSITQILVPIDFSPHSRQALQTAININKNLENPATIIVLHVYEMPTLSNYKIGYTLETYQDTVKDNLAKTMENFLASFASEDRSLIKTQLASKKFWSTAKQINSIAKKENIDFVVMGIKGHSRVETLLLGSVAERFITLNKSIATMMVR